MISKTFYNPRSGPIGLAPFPPTRYRTIPEPAPAVGAANSVATQEDHDETDRGTNELVF